MEPLFLTSSVILTTKTKNTNQDEYIGYTHIYKLLLKKINIARNILH